MRLNFLTRWLGCLAMVAALAAPAPAQSAKSEMPHRYVPFEIDPDYEARLKNRLQLEKQLGPLKELVKQIAADPKKFPLDLDKMKDLKLDDPALLHAVQQWVGSNPSLKQALHDWIKQNPVDKKQPEAQQLRKQLNSILEQPTAKIMPGMNEDNLKAAPAQPKPSDGGKPNEDPLAKAAEQAMKQAEESKLGDWLRNSPAWQRAFEDLQTSFHNPQATAGNWTRWSEQLRIPDETFWQLGEQSLDRLRNLPRPDPSEWNWRPLMPALGPMHLPKLHGPALPSGSGPTLPTFGVLLSWMLFLLLCALAAWQMKRWVRNEPASPSGQATLGPWPVRPERVATRSELVQAFNYLALLTLGLEVKSWNHQAIARLWTLRSAANAESAVALANLYELARYTEGGEELSEFQRHQARHCFQQLAEAF